MGTVRYRTSKEIAESKKRADRDARLKLDVDQVTPLIWDSLTEQQRQEWRDYRKSLLDLPQQSGFPESATLPERPSTIGRVRRNPSEE